MTRYIRDENNSHCKDLYDQQSEVITLVIKCQDGDFGNITVHKGEDLDIAAEQFGAKHSMDLLAINQLSEQIKQRCKIIYEFNSSKPSSSKGSPATRDLKNDVSTVNEETTNKVVRKKGVMTLDSIHDGYSSSDTEKNDPGDRSSGNYANKTDDVNARHDNHQYSHSSKKHYDNYSKKAICEGDIYYNDDKMHHNYGHDYYNDRNDNNDNHNNNNNNNSNNNNDERQEKSTNI